MSDWKTEQGLEMKVGQVWQPKLRERIDLEIAVTEKRLEALRRAKAALTPEMERLIDALAEARIDGRLF